MKILKKVETKNIFLLLAILILISFTILSCSKAPKDPDSTDETELNSDTEKDGGDDALSEEDDATTEEGETTTEEGDATEEGASDSSEINEDKAYDEVQSDATAAGEEVQSETKSTDELFADEGGSGASPDEAVAPVSSANMIKYSVQSGDTLLKISFKVFRSYERWKELLQYNPEIQNPNSIEIGQQINYPSEYQQRVLANVRGEYWIKAGQTLGSISQELYGTPEHWRAIANLNPEKIRNPNKIYAGTTINVTLRDIPRAEPGQASAETPVTEETVAEEKASEAVQGTETTTGEESGEEEVVEEEVVEEEV